MHISYCRRSWNEEMQPGPSSAARHEDLDRAAGNAENAVLNPVLGERRERLLVNKELCLYPLTFLLAIVSAAVLVMLVAPKQTPATLSSRTSVHKSCNSAICLQDAAYLSNLLSWEVDPCEDFYKYVCGRWTNAVPALGADKTASSDDDYVGNLESTIHGLLQNRSEQSGMILPLQSLFDQCVNVSRIEVAGWGPLLEVMFHVSLEGFPITPPVRSSVSVWRMAARILRKTGAAALLSVGVVSHPWNTSSDIASLGPPEALVTIAGIDMNEAIRHYTIGAFSSLRALRKEFLPPVYTLDIARFASDLERLFQQKTNIFNFKVEKIDSGSPLYSFLSEVFAGVPNAIYSGPESEILIYNPDFVFSLVELVQKTETHTVMNFLGVRLMVQTSALLPQSELVDVFSSLVYGKLRAGLPRWKLCLRVVENALTPLFHFLALVHFSLHMPAEKISELVSEIVEAFSRGMDQAAYLNNASKIAIRHLITKTQFKVLGAFWMNDKSLLNEYIRKIPSNFSTTALDTYVLTFEYNFLSTLTRSSYERWSHTAFSTNCWFERHPRTIYVPMLLFNSTLALDNRTDSFQLSRAGVRVGRCIFEMLLSETDAVEDSGQWLNEETKLKLNEVLRCLGDKDIGQEMKKLPEVSATHFTLSHFQKIVKSSAEELRLTLARNEDFGAGKLFFVYLALQSCEKKTAKTELRLPGRETFFNDALRQEPGFHEEFNCSTGSSMYPTHQCVL
ncbi:neprilysin-1-like [Ixodes scapularis]|uniref:neprilysin-1-like n=1 Tax=Ixodes scapularis TaxID=6945 RepID=UPI001A9E46BB|nr:neprilysin-1-like [Ixodes scapularis]